VFKPPNALVILGTIAFTVRSCASIHSGMYCYYYYYLILKIIIIIFRWHVNGGNKEKKKNGKLIGMKIKMREKMRNK